MSVFRLYSSVAEFRSVSRDEPCLNLRGDRGMTLILLGGDGSVHWGRTVGDKENLRSLYKPEDGDEMLLAWNGNYTTDLFRLDQGDIRKHWSPDR